MGKVEICNSADSYGRIDFLYRQKCLLNSSPQFVRLLSKSLNLIGCRDSINGKFSNKIFSKTINRTKVKLSDLAYMLMTLASSEVVFFYCRATADILTKLLDSYCCIYTRPIVR